MKIKGVKICLKKKKMKEKNINEEDIVTCLKNKKIKKGNRQKIYITCQHGYINEWYKMQRPGVVSVCTSKKSKTKKISYYLYIFSFMAFYVIFIIFFVKKNMLKQICKQMRKIIFFVPFEVGTETAPSHCIIHYFNKYILSSYYCRIFLSTYFQEKRSFRCY